jgi:putative PEP-CTERM system histidine kinase
MIYGIGFALSAAFFFLLAAFQTLRLGGRSPSYLLAAACLTHALWSSAPLINGQPGQLFEMVVELLRPLVWAAFFIALTQPTSQLRRWAMPAIGVLLVGANLANLYADLAMVSAGVPVTGTTLVAAALGLVVTVSVFRSAGESERWTLKALALPLAALFGYDIILFTTTLATVTPQAPAFAARGLLSAVVAIPIGIGLFRLQLWQSDFRLSHQAALYSTALIALGAYFVLVGAIGTFVRVRPGLLPVQIQITFLFISLLAAFFILYSGTVRARVKFFIGRHFFRRKYDYQHEWRKLMDTLATEGGTPLENRVIRACANLLESPGGALWMLDGTRPRLEATWNFRPPSLPDKVPADTFQRANGRFVALTAADLRGVLDLPTDACWLAAPLPLDDHLLGILVLAHPRADHVFDGEDEQLIMLAARQCASHLSEKRATVELEEHRQFARFNRQYAFVAHDIKNLMSQLSVMLKNFDRYADDPDFQQDMRQTVGYTVERMQYLVHRLNALREGHETTVEGTRALLASAVQQAAQQFQTAGGRVEVAVRPNAESLEVPADPDRLVAIVGHLLANAGEATGPNGRVSVEVDTQAGAAIVDVIDDGPGMSADFIRDSLFSPFRSNKRHGFGVGAYQCREFARERGGDLDVISSPGSGTTMRLKLPALVGAGDDVTLGANG